MIVVAMALKPFGAHGGRSIDEALTSSTSGSWIVKVNLVEQVTMIIYDSASFS